MLFEVQVISGDINMEGEGVQFPVQPKPYGLVYTYIYIFIELFEIRHMHGGISNYFNA